MKDITNRAKVASICERLRKQAEQAEWKGVSGLTDKAIMLSALDVAQWTGRLAIYFDVRSASYAAGVTTKTASKSLRRLIKGNWLWRDPRRRHPRDAQTYVINFRYPHVWYSPPPPTGSQPGEGERVRLYGESGLYSPQTITRPVRGQTSTSLVEFFSRVGGTTTQGVTRRWLLIGRTEFGVMMGKHAVWIYLHLSDTAQTISDLARVTGFDRKTVRGNLDKYLAPMGLAVKAGDAWVLGTKLEEYTETQLVGREGKLVNEPFTPSRVKQRLAQIERDREVHAWRYPVSEEEWTQHELEMSKLHTETSNVDS